MRGLHAYGLGEINAPGFTRTASRWGESGTYEVGCEQSMLCCRNQDMRLIVTRTCPPLETIDLAVNPAVILAEERELETVTHLRVVAVGLRLEEVMPRHAVVVGDHLPVLLRAEELLLHEHAL